MKEGSRSRLEIAAAEAALGARVDGRDEGPWPWPWLDRALIRGFEDRV